MKKNVLIILSVLLLAFTSCRVQEKVSGANANFTVDAEIGLDAALTLNFESGDNDFLTVFPGDSLHRYEYYPQETGEKVTGVTHTLTYDKVGTYNITALAINYGNYSEDQEMNIVTKQVSVVDNRNKLNTFEIKDLFIGEIINDTINVRYPIQRNRSSLITKFTLNSDNAKVFINGIEVISEVTSVDLTTNPTTINVVAANGDTANYYLKMDLYTGKTGNSLATFKTVNPSVDGVIDEGAGTITCTSTPGQISNAKIVGLASNWTLTSESAGARVYVNGVYQTAKVTKNDFTNPVVYTVISEAGVSRTYTVTVIRP